VDFDGQHPNEKVINFYRLHPIILRKKLIFLMLAILIGATPFAFIPWEPWTWISAASGLVIGVIVFMYGYLGWYFSYLILTDKRIVQIKQKGFFDRQLIELGLDKIQNVTLSIKGIQQNIFHFGTIVIRTFSGNLVINNIYKPQKVHEQITRQIDKHKNNDVTAEGE
jgi:membrane protein YdbS with pleckstrin-like domain